MKSAQGIQLESFINQRRNVVITISLIVASVILTIFATIPQGFSIQQLKNELREENNLLILLETKKTKLLDIKESNIFNQKDKVEEVLPSNKSIQELLVNLEAVSIEAQIGIVEYLSNPGAIASASASRAVQAEKKQDGDNSQFIKLETKIIGELANIQKFFSLIERISPLTSVSDLSLEYAHDDSEQSVLMTEAALTLNTYYFNRQINADTENPLPEIQEDEKKAINEILFFTPSYLKDKQTDVTGGLEDPFGAEKPNIEPAR